MLRKSLGYVGTVICVMMVIATLVIACVPQKMLTGLSVPICNVPWLGRLVCDRTDKYMYIFKKNDDDEGDL